MRRTAAGVVLGWWRCRPSLPHRRRPHHPTPSAPTPQDEYAAVDAALTRLHASLRRETAALEAAGRAMLATAAGGGGDGIGGARCEACNAGGDGVEGERAAGYGGTPARAASLPTATDPMPATTEPARRPPSPAVVVLSDDDDEDEVEVEEEEGGGANGAAGHCDGADEGVATPSRPPGASDSLDEGNGVVEVSSSDDDEVFGGGGDARSPGGSDAGASAARGHQDARRADGVRFHQEYAVPGVTRAVKTALEPGPRAGESEGAARCPP